MYEQLTKHFNNERVIKEYIKVDSLIRNHTRIMTMLSNPEIKSIDTIRKLRAHQYNVADTYKRYLAMHNTTHRPDKTTELYVKCKEFCKGLEQYLTEKYTGSKDVKNPGRIAYRDSENLTVSGLALSLITMASYTAGTCYFVSNYPKLDNEEWVDNYGEVLDKLISELKRAVREDETGTAIWDDSRDLSVFNFIPNTPTGHIEYIIHTISEFDSEYFVVTESRDGDDKYKSFYNDLVEYFNSGINRRINKKFRLDINLTPKQRASLTRLKSLLRSRLAGVSDIEIEFKNYNCIEVYKDVLEIAKRYIN